MLVTMGRGYIVSVVKGGGVRRVGYGVFYGGVSGSVVDVEREKAFAGVVYFDGMIEQVDARQVEVLGLIWREPSK